MATINGTDLTIWIGGVKIGKQTECSVEVSDATFDTTTKDSGGWEDNEAGLKSWTMTSNGIIDFDAAYGIEDIMDAILTRQTVDIRFSTSTVGTLKYTGTARPINVKETAPMEDKPTWEVSFKGKGALTKGTV